MLIYYFSGIIEMISEVGLGLLFWSIWDGKFPGYYRIYSRYEAQESVKIARKTLATQV